MVVGATQAPSLNRVNATSGDEHAVSHGSEANALVDERDARAAEHGEALRSQALEIVAGRTIGVDRLEVQGVTRSNPIGLELHGSLHGPTPFIRGSTSEFGT